jgi:phage tail-like protein
MKSIDKILPGLAAIMLLLSFSAIPASHGDVPLPLKGNYNFLLEIAGVVQGRFANVTGLSAEIEVVEFREGGDDGVIRKIPGRTIYGDITLERGYTATDDLWSWLQDIIDGELVRKNGSIRVTSHNGSELVRFNFFNAWPSKYELGVGVANGNDIAIEELTLTVERIELE